MTSTGRRNRWRNFKERILLQVVPSLNLKKHRPNWSDLPLDIVEGITKRLYWGDRIRISAVCKAWSAPNHHIPAIDKVPWAMRFNIFGTYNDRCQLLDPLSREYVVEGSNRTWQEYGDFHYALPRASAYGWVLFVTASKTKTPGFLYSPFTTEVIKLPELGDPDRFRVAALCLNANSPKCVVFLLRVEGDKIYVKLCSPGDHSWKSLEFKNGLDWPHWGVNAIYANGVFYCVFKGGELGAFNVELEEWTMLTDRPLTETRYMNAKLIVSNADLLMLDESSLESLKLYKFDFLDMRWVKDENNLNNQVLFIGCTSFSAPAVGETSALENTVFSCNRILHSVRCYVNRPCIRSRRRQLLYRKCVKATGCALVWIELPLGGIWRANDLINAV